MFGKFNKSKEVEISRDELNEMRAARIAETIPTQEENAYPVPMMQFKPNEGLVTSGTGLIKGIEFGPDIMPVGVSPDDYSAIVVPVKTIYPPINSYIGNDMDFQQIHDYNNSQNIYFTNPAKVLLAERVNFLLDNILEEFRLVIKTISLDMVKEANEINNKAGRNCRDCEGDYSCQDCPANKYTNVYSSITTRHIVQLLPQLIDIDFYNTIKNDGGIIKNKEIIQVTSMAFAGILLNKVKVNAIDEIAHIESMSEINSAVQQAAGKVMEMIITIIQEENIINLVDHNVNYMWKPTITTDQLADKL